MIEKEEMDKMIDTITEQQRELSQNALNEFNKYNFLSYLRPFFFANNMNFASRKNYVGCLQNLNKIDGRSNDFKIAHNKAVVELYKNDMKKVDLFQKTLNSIFSQVKTKN